MTVQSGSLRVSGETVKGPTPSDLFDLFTDALGDLVLVLLDVRNLPADLTDLGDTLLQALRENLDDHEPLHSVVNALEVQLAAHPGVEAGVILLRVSRRDSRVELLNAGMPPVARAAAGGYLAQHPPLSGAVGSRVGEVHPYEVLPLVWGTTWLAASDGMTGGSLDAVATQALCHRVGLAENGPALASSARATLLGTLETALSAHPPAQDATAIFLHADGTGPDRFASGIDQR